MVVKDSAGASTVIRQSLRLAILLVLAQALSTQGEEAAAPPSDGSRPIFDGKTLQGWEGNLGTFRIEDGAIVGGSLKAAIPRNEYLCTVERFDNFELRLKFRVLGGTLDNRIPNAASNSAASECRRATK